MPLCQCAPLNASVGVICSSAGDHQSLCECVAPLTPVHPLVAERCQDPLLQALLPQDSELHQQEVLRDSDRMITSGGMFLQSPWGIGAVSPTRPSWSTHCRVRGVLNFLSGERGCCLLPRPASSEPDHDAPCSDLGTTGPTGHAGGLHYKVDGSLQHRSTGGGSEDR